MYNTQLCIEYSKTNIKKIDLDLRGLFELKTKRIELFTQKDEKQNYKLKRLSAAARSLKRCSEGLEGTKLRQRYIALIEQVLGHISGSAMKLIIVLTFCLGFVACIPDPRDRVMIIYPGESGPAPMPKSHQSGNFLLPSV